MTAESALPTCYARVVLDTNVLLSAALAPHGAPAELLDLLLQEGRLVFSKATFSELESRIWKPKFDRYLLIDRRQRLLRDFDASASWVGVQPKLAARHFSRDPTDDPFIHAALAANVCRLVSSDDDLLCLHPLGELHILTPRAALVEINRLRGSDP